MLCNELAVLFEHSAIRCVRFGLIETEPEFIFGRAGCVGIGGQGDDRQQQQYPGDSARARVTVLANCGGSGTEHDGLLAGWAGDSVPSSRRPDSGSVRVACCAIREQSGSIVATAQRAPDKSFHAVWVR